MVLFYFFIFFNFKGLKLGRNIPDFYEIVTAPILKVCDHLLGLATVAVFLLTASRATHILCLQILNRWFESEPLRATLATDAVIGAMTSPSNPGSGWDPFSERSKLQAWLQRPAEKTLMLWSCLEGMCSCTMWWESWRRRRGHGVMWREEWAACLRPSLALLDPVV